MRKYVLFEIVVRMPQSICAAKKCRLLRSFVKHAMRLTQGKRAFVWLMRMGALTCGESPFWVSVSDYGGQLGIVKVCGSDACFLLNKCDKAVTLKHI